MKGPPKQNSNTLLQFKATYVALCATQHTQPYPNILRALDDAFKAH